jgi:hypothetical protein
MSEHIYYHDTKVEWHASPGGEFLDMTKGVAAKKQAAVYNAEKDMFKKFQMW